MVKTLSSLLTAVFVFAALRHCYRCTECHSTLLPGSYTLGVVSGALVCRHHAARSTSDSQNGRPDLSKRPAAVQSARTGRSGAPHTPPPPERERAHDSNEPAADVAVVNDSLEIREDVGGETKETSHSAVPRNPFESDGDEEEEEEEEETKDEEEELPPQLTANGELQPPAPTAAAHQEGAGRPVPAPRRVLEPSPPPRPAPRIRLLRATDGPSALPRLNTR